MKRALVMFVIGALVVVSLALWVLKGASPEIPGR